MSAIFYDIDGTLLGRDHIVPEDTKEALRLLRANGHYLFINTGRSRYFARTDHMPELGFHGMLTAGGTCIEYQDQVLLEKRMPLELIQRAVNLFYKYDRPMVLEGLHQIYTDIDLLLADEKGRRYYGMLSKIPCLLSTKENWNQLTVSKFTAILGDAPLDLLYEALQDDFEIVNQQNVVMECVPKGFTKATAMEFICKHLDISMEDTYAFGDGNNDIQMLEAAGTGIAMGNGSELSKEHADYITDAWNEGGIISACKHFGIL